MSALCIFTISISWEVSCHVMFEQLFEEIKLLRIIFIKHPQDNNSDQPVGTSTIRAQNQKLTPKTQSKLSQINYPLNLKQFNRVSSTLKF